MTQTLVRGGLYMSTLNLVQSIKQRKECGSWAGDDAVQQSDPTKTRGSGGQRPSIKGVPSAAMESVATGLPVTAEAAKTASAGGRPAALPKDWGSLLPVWGIPGSAPLLLRPRPLLDHDKLFSGEQLRLSAFTIIEGVGGRQKSHALKGVPAVGGKKPSTNGQQQLEESTCLCAPQMQT